MLESLEIFLRPAFAVAAVGYLFLAIRVSRTSPQYSMSAIAFFLVLIGALVAAAAFSYGTADPVLFGIGRALLFSASGFLAIVFYIVYREYTVGPPSAFLIIILSVVPVATTVLAMTNPLHNMIWATVQTQTGVRFTDVTEHAWFLNVHAPFMYGLIAYSLVALAGRLPSIAVAHRKSVLLLIGSAILPFLVSLGNTMFSIGPKEFPFTAVTLTVLLPVFAYVSVTLRLYEFSPFAYQTLFNHVRDPIIVIDSSQHIVCVNKSAQELLGASEKELIGQHLWEDFEEARHMLDQARELDLTQTLQMRNEAIYELSVQPLTGRKGQNLGMVVVCRDVTERRKAQARLAESEQLIRTLIETSSNGILRFANSRDGEGNRFRCIFANRAAESHLSDGNGTLVGMPLDKLPQLDPERLIEHFDVDVEKRNTVSYETATENDDGEVWLRIVGEPVGDDISVTLIDITQRKRSEDKMLADALRDPLTGVWNRRGFEKEGKQRLGREQEGAVLYLDLNQFKSINDRFGHQAGDALLKAFGHRLEFCLRPEDVLGRLGGDEFAIVLPGISVADAKHVATRLLQTAQEAYIIQGQEIKCTASVGLALMPQHGEELWHLTSVADQAMYNAKALSQEQAANDPAAYIEAATAS